MKEPQIGIEPMTARCGNTAAVVSPSETHPTSEWNGRQWAPEARPNRHQSGNEVATQDVPWTRMENGTRRHEYLIDQMVAMGWQRTGLREELRRRAAAELGRLVDDERAVDDEPLAWELEDTEWQYVLRYLDRRIPDAWRIVEEGADHGWAYPVTVLELLEVVVSHSLTPAKRVDYARLWMAGDCCERVAVRVLGMDPMGYVFPMMATVDDYSTAMTSYIALEAA